MHENAHGGTRTNILEVFRDELRLLILLFLAGGELLVGIFCMYPFIAQVSVSVRPGAELNSNNVLIAGTPKVNT